MAYYGGSGSFNDRMAAYWSTPILNSCVSWWRSSDYIGSGDLLDGSGNGHHLTINGPTFAGGVFSLVDNDYFECADHADFDFAANESFTVAIGMKLAGAPSGTAAWMAKRTSAAASGTTVGWVLFSGSGSLIGRLIFADGTGFVQATKTAITANVATLLAGVRSVAADTGTAYVNGSAGTAVVDPTTNTLANSSAFRIGRLSGAASGAGAMTAFYGAAIARSRLLPGDLNRLKVELGAV